MFSKAKRFPEGGNKDYIPGPGEYDLNLDGSGRHKRYGFLTQTNRFPEGTEPSESSEFYTHHHQNESSTTMASISSDTRLSSTTSSNRTPSPDESNSPITTTTSPTSIKSTIMWKKLPTSPTEVNHHHHAAAQQYEKYKITMQKEVEALQLKLNKMEATVESLEADKNETKSILLTKDLEMADLRSKNATLQKTINRHEKSTKVAQLQKKVEQLEEQLTSLKNYHEKELQDKNKTLQELQEKSNRSDDTINNLELVQKERQNEIEALEALNTSLSAQLSESKNKEIENEAQINILQLELKDMQSENGKLLCDLDISETEIKELKSLNNELMNKLQIQQDNISQLESRVALKDEEIDALLNTIIERDTTVQEKNTVIENIQNQFRTYRNWIDHTVIPHLRLQRKKTENHHYAELNLLLTELHEAKKFINYQAQYLNALKSDIHWLNVQNKQLNEIIASMIEEQKEQHGGSGYYLNNNKSIGKISPPSSKQKKQQQQQQKKKHKINDVIPLDDTSDSTTVSNSSSRSTISSHCDTTKHDSLDSNLIVLNDSGFGILVDDDAK